jgi:hypothetical protein
MTSRQGLASLFGRMNGNIYLLFLILAISSLMCNLPGTSTPSGNEQEEVNPAEVEDTGVKEKDQEDVTLPEAQKGIAADYGEIYKPVGFVNQGTVNAMVMPCTWTPPGSSEPTAPPSVSTISIHPGESGLWSNPSRFISLPLGTYTWCIQYDEGDQDGDGMIDYFYFIDEREVTLSENDSDEHNTAKEVNFTAPPGMGMDIFSGTCNAAAQCLNLGGIQAIFIAGATMMGDAGQNVEYNAGLTTVFIDPAATAWIAWNNMPSVSFSRDSQPGETFLGPGGFGTDDYITLTVINPEGETLIVDLDQNDAYGRWEGPQNVIYGTSEEAPDVTRQYPSFADPPNKEFFIDEPGSHNDIFTVAGAYTFQFSFRNKFIGSASHSDVYLLISPR